MTEVKDDIFGAKENNDHNHGINPGFLGNNDKKKKKKYTVDEFVSGIISGDRVILSQAITLLESSLQENIDTIQTILEKCLPYSGKSVRIGITGVPGVGKSTFIESFGLNIVSEGRKLAVLAIDPSSEHTKGSILGDKTRMEKLSTHPDAFIRPSPTAGTLGGVARKTSETIILCEAAGFDTIVVETVGVGQSETTVHSMVDFFLLLMLAGSGDEIQGIKRGIMEMANAIAITKADGYNKTAADNAKILFQNTVQLLPPHVSGWKTEVVTCSALEKRGIRDLWERTKEYFDFIKKTGFFNEQRKMQSVVRMHDSIIEDIVDSFYNDKDVIFFKPLIEQQLYEGKVTPYKAATMLVEKYYKK